MKTSIKVRFSTHGIQSDEQKNLPADIKGTWQDEFEYLLVEDLKADHIQGPVRYYLKASAATIVCRINTTPHLLRFVGVYPYGGRIGHSQRTPSLYEVLDSADIWLSYERADIAEKENKSSTSVTIATTADTGEDCTLPVATGIEAIPIEADVIPPIKKATIKVRLPANNVLSNAQKSLPDDIRDVWQEELESLVLADLKAGQFHGAVRYHLKTCPAEIVCRINTTPHVLYLVGAYPFGMRIGYMEKTPSLYEVLDSADIWISYKAVETEMKQSRVKEAESQATFSPSLSISPTPSSESGSVITVVASTPPSLISKLEANETAKGGTSLHVAMPIPRIEVHEILLPEQGSTIGRTSQATHSSSPNASSSSLLTTYVGSSASSSDFRLSHLPNNTTTDLPDLGNNFIVPPEPYEAEALLRWLPQLEYRDTAASRPLAPRMRSSRKTIAKAAKRIGKAFKLIGSVFAPF